MKLMADEMALLFSRLKWPPGIIRERACTVIAELMAFSPNSKGISAAFLEWMDIQNLESMAATGLLIPIRAKFMNPKVALPNERELCNAIRFPSILSGMLMSEIFPDAYEKSNGKTLHSGPAPASFTPDTFFEKHVENYLPPAYLYNAKWIEREFNTPFIKQWSFEWNKIVERTGQKLLTGPLNFMGNRSEEHYVAIDFTLSEVYRSAYLRAIAWAIDSSSLPLDFGEYLVIQTSPIDLELWELKLSASPEWWPKAKEPAGQIETAPEEIWKQIRKLWEAQAGEEWKILQATGRIDAGASVYELQVHSIFQKYRDLSMPDLKELLDWMQRNTIHHDQRGMRFEGSIEPISPNSVAKGFSGWDVVPADMRICPSTISRWQYYRLYREIWFPSPFLGRPPYSFRCEKNAIEIFDDYGVLAKWSDWVDGLKEKIEANLLPSCGNFLLLRKEVIQEFEEQAKAKFCWVCRLTCFKKKGFREPYEEIADFRHFGSTNIIIP